MVKFPWFKLWASTQFSMHASNQDGHAFLPKAPWIHGHRAQAVTQIHHTLNFSVTHIGNHGVQSRQIAMNI
jgi:hypothetical protein